MNLRIIVFLLTASLTWSAEPPYTLPTAGNVVTIGTNTVMDLAPVFPAATGNSFFGSVFVGAFGSGVFIRDYSPRGAYVLAAMGGHAASFQLTGAVLFDFEDATWKGFENSNGVPSYTGQMTGQNNSNGDPWMEWTGTEVPIPAHTYLAPAELPASLGGGPKGSLLLLGRGAVKSDGGGGRGPHALNLATLRWSRMTSADHPRVVGIYTSVVFDEAKGRYYPIGGIERTKQREYYDAANWDSLYYTWPMYGWPAFGGGGFAFMDSVRRLIIDFASSELHAFQLDNPGAGWSVLTVSGTLPTAGAEPCRWAYYPPDGNFYYRPGGNGGSKLYRLIPPSQNPLTSAWIADSVALNLSMPDCAGPAWYNYLFYVPSIRSLAWITGTSNPVHIFKPPVYSGSQTEALKTTASALTLATLANPFHSTTRVSIHLPQDMSMTLDVYDVSGRCVRSLARGWASHGAHVYEWDATDGNGLKVGPGVYLYKLTTSEKTLIVKTLYTR